MFIARGGAVGEGRLVPERFQQPRHAVAMLGAAQEDGADLAISQINAEIVEHAVARQLHVAENGLQKLIIIVGELFQHREAGFGQFGQFGGEVDHFAWRMLAVDKGALEGQIDKAGGDAILPDRDLPEHQGQRTGGLQHRQNFANRQLDLVDLIEKQKMRDFAVDEGFQKDLQRGKLFLVRLADNDCCIAHCQRRGGVKLKFHRSGAIDEGELVAQKSDVGEVGLDAHRMSPGFGGCVANHIAGGHRALALDCSSPGQNGFEKGGLAAQIWPYECNAPGASGSMAI